MHVHTSTTNGVGASPQPLQAHEQRSVGVLQRGGRSRGGGGGVCLGLPLGARARRARKRHKLRQRAVDPAAVARSHGCYVQPHHLHSRQSISGQVRVLTASERLLQVACCSTRETQFQRLPSLSMCLSSTLLPP